jgi:hypothetical protein
LGSRIAIFGWFRTIYAIRTIAEMLRDGFQYDIMPESDEDTLPIQESHQGGAVLSSSSEERSSEDLLSGSDESVRDIRAWWQGFCELIVGTTLFVFAVTMVMVCYYALLSAAEETQ